MGGGDLGRRGWAHRDKFQARVGAGPADRWLPPGVQRHDAVDAIRRHDRREHLSPATRCDQRRDPRQGCRLKTQHAAQQGSPWKRDRDQVDAPDERRVVEGGGAGRQEDRIPRTATSRSPRSLGHRGCDRVHADHQGGRFCGRPGQHRPAIARTDIDDHPVGPGDQLVELADVDVEDAPADDLSHGPQSTLGR